MWPELKVWTLLPGLLAAVLYSNTIGHGFTLDDDLVYAKNRYVLAGWSGIDDILTHTMIHGFGGTNDGLYRPLSQLTFAAEQSAFGMNPGRSHGLNVLLYALSGVMLCAFLRCLLRDQPAAIPLVTALLFVAHPVHTEVVASIKGRDEILAFLCFVGSAWSLLRHVDGGRFGALVAALSLFGLALLSKESAIALIVVIPAMLAAFRRQTIWRTLSCTAPFALVALLWLGWRTYVVHSMGRPPGEGSFELLNNSLFAADGLSERLATAAWLQVLYLWKLIYPHRLLYDYSYNQIPVIGISDSKALFGILLLVAIVSLLWRGRFNRICAFGGFFYFAALAPVSNVFMLIGTTFAERFLYTPSLGFALVAASLIATAFCVDSASDDLRLVGFFSRNRAFAIFVIVVVGLLGARTVIRSADWSDNETLFAADVPYLRSSARANYNYGAVLSDRAAAESSALIKEALLGRAVEHLEHAIEIYPDYADARNNLGLAYKKRGELLEARRAFEELLASRPGYLKAWFNLGLTSRALGRFDLAEQEFRRYLSRVPSSSMALYYLGDCLGQQQRYQEAAEVLEQSHRLAPDRPATLLLLGKALGLLGDNNAALRRLEEAAQLEPESAEIQDTLGIGYMVSGDPKSAVKAFRHLVRLRPGPESLAKLADAYERSGDFARATQLREESLPHP